MRSPYGRKMKNVFPAMPALIIAQKNQFKLKLIAHLNFVQIKMEDILIRMQQ